MACCDSCAAGGPCDGAAPPPVEEPCCDSCAVGGPCEGGDDHHHDHPEPVVGVPVAIDPVLPEDVIDVPTLEAVAPVIEAAAMPQFEQPGMLLPGRMALLHREPEQIAATDMASYTHREAEYGLAGGPVHTYRTTPLAYFGNGRRGLRVHTDRLRWSGNPNYAIFWPDHIWETEGIIDGRHHGSYFGYHPRARQRSVRNVMGQPLRSRPRPVSYSIPPSIRPRASFGAAARGPCGPTTPGCGGHMVQGPAWDGGESYPAYSSGHYGAYFGHCGKSKMQQRAHIIGEAAGLLIAAPYLWWASNQTENTRAKYGLRALAVSTAALDGWLLWRNLRAAYSRNTA